MLHVHQAAMPCRISSIVSDARFNNGLEQPNDGETIRNGETGRVWIETARPIVIEPADEYPKLRRFVLRDGRTVAMGTCCELAGESEAGG